jgi:hypothetical protein
MYFHLMYNCKLLCYGHEGAVIKDVYFNKQF